MQDLEAYERAAWKCLISSRYWPIDMERADLKRAYSTRAAL